jgi:hypothetical protein
MRSLLVLCLLAAPAFAQPALTPTGVAEPAPADPTAPPPPYPPPPTTTPVMYTPYAPQPEPEPRVERVFVGLGAVIGGGGPSDWLYGAYHADIGVTILPSPVRLRARGLLVLAGGTMESDWGGDFTRWGVGVEARSCTRRGGGCLFADLDVGYQRLTLYDHNGDFVRADNGAFVGPRFGFDAGGNFRFRFAFELYRQYSDRSGSFPTFGMSIGVGYQR